MRLLRRLLALSLRDWRDHLAAHRLLILAEWQIRRRPVGGLLDEWATASTAARDVGPADHTRAGELGAAVRRVARYGVPRSQCLARSLAICELLERNGIHGAQLRIGVQPSNMALSAHAWVDLHGHIIGDTADHVAAFLPLANSSGATRF